MTIRNAVNAWVEETGGYVKQNAAIRSLTDEFSSRLKYEAADLNVEVYAEKPSCAAASVCVEVSLAKNHPHYHGKQAGTKMKIIQFEPAVRLDKRKRYVRWHLYRPSTELRLYVCDTGEEMGAEEDCELADYVKSMAAFLSARNERFEKCSQILADAFGEDFLSELQTSDGPLSEFKKQ